MREFERIDRILSKIRDYWKRNPDLRFFQLMFNLQFSYSKNNNYFGMVTNADNKLPPYGFDFFNMEDDIFEKYLDKYIK